MSKEKQYSVKLHDFFFVFCWMDIFFKRLNIYKSGITMNISNTWPVTVIFNLFQINLIFPVLKKVARMNAFVHPTYGHPT